MRIAQTSKHRKTNLEKFNLWFKNLNTRQQTAIYAAVFAVIGLLMLSLIRAAGPFAALEPESATLTTGATIGTDATASSGQYVQFGSQPATACSQTVSPGVNLNSLLTSAAADSVICLNNGSYGTVTISASRSTYATLRAVNQSQATFTKINLANASHIGFEKIKVNGVIESGQDNTNHIRIAATENLGVTIEAGTSGTGPNNWTIEYNDIHDCPGNCVTLGSDDPDIYKPVSDVIIRGNKIGPMGGGEDAIRIHNWIDTLVEDNEIFGVLEDGQHNDCLQSVWGGHGIIFRRNYLHDNNCQTFFLKDGYTYDILLDDNLSIRNRAGDAEPVVGQIWTSANVTMQNNTFWDDSAFYFRTGAVASMFSTGPVEDYEVINNVINNFLPYDDNSTPQNRAGIFTNPSILHEDYNLFCEGWTWVPGSMGDHSKQSCTPSPSFVNPTANATADLASGDYRLSSQITQGGQTYSAGITWVLAGREFGIASYPH